LSPRHGSLLTGSFGGEPVSQTYLNRRRGRLKFILGFEKLVGVYLKLTIKGPDGTVLEKDGKEGFEIEVPDAVPGDWTSYLRPGLEHDHVADDEPEWHGRKLADNRDPAYETDRRRLQAPSQSPARPDERPYEGRSPEHGVATGRRARLRPSAPG
jgi:hypothetical protein